MTLTKIQMVNEIAQQNGFPKKQSAGIVETVLEIIKNALESVDDVLISGFGKFCLREKHQRKGRRNPATGEDMMLRPRRVVTFRCSGKLRAKINSRESQ